MDEDATFVTITMHIADPVMSVAQIEDLVGAKDSGLSSSWTHTVTARDDIRLSEQLMRAQEFVGEKKSILMGMVDSVVHL